MAKKKNGTAPRSSRSQPAAQDPARRAPAPPPPIQYTHSANMPGYEEELMPPRRVHAAVDNGIEFPTGTQRRTPSGSGSGQARRTARPDNTAELPRRPARPAAEAQEPPRRQSGQTKKQKQTARPPRDPAQREARRKKQITKATMRRRRILRRVSAALALLCVIVVGTFLTMTMLFKITSIEVRGADGALAEQVGAYSRQDILNALGVQMEENIFSFSAAGRAAEMEKQLPLLENIRVTRNYPGTVVVQATPAVAVCTMPTRSGWLGLSATLKILSVDQQQPALPILYGGEPVSTTPGDQLDFRSEAAASSEAAGSEAAPTDTRMDVLYAVLEQLNEQGLIAGATRLEFADTEQVAFLYENRISVLLGTVNELEYKMTFAAHLLLNVDGKGCAPTDTGRIDCSHLRTDGTLQAILARGDPVLPSGYVPPEPTPEPEPEAEPAAPEEETPAPEA